MTSMQTTNPAERNQEATVYVGGLDEKVTEELLWELMIQAAPVKYVYIPRDRITGQTQGYGFCEFKNEEDAAYATKVMNMIRLFGKPIRVQQSSMDKRGLDVGANLFVGNLDPEVDEKLLYDTFSAFGYIIEAPHIMMDPDSGTSKGYGFIKYNSFDASDAAIEAMNGQFLQNRSIVVQYAYKKDSTGSVRERHGSEAERLLAARAAQLTPSGPQPTQPLAAMPPAPAPGQPAPAPAFARPAMAPSYPPPAAAPGYAPPGYPRTAPNGAAPYMPGQPIPRPMGPPPGPVPAYAGAVQRPIMYPMAPPPSMPPPPMRPPIMYPPPAQPPPNMPPPPMQPPPAQPPPAQPPPSMPPPPPRK